MVDMSADLQDLARGGRGNSGGGWGHHAFGKVAGYEIQPGSTRERPNHNDKVIVNLTRPTLGFEASEDAPVQITVKIEPPKPSSNPKARPTLSVIHLMRGRDAAKETEVGDYLTLKDIKRDGDGFVARRAEVAVRKFKKEHHFAYSGLFAIRPEREGKNQDGSPRFSQQRIGMLTQFADPVASIDEFRERALQALADAANVHGARPHFVLRGIQQNELGKHHFSIAREVGLYDYEARKEYTPEEAIERFISGDDGNNGPKILQYLGGEGILFEVIPQFRVNTGKASLPTYKRQNAEDNGRVISDKDAWKFDDGHNMRFMEGERTETGYANMDVILQRKESETRPGEMGMTHTIFAQPQRPSQPLFKLSEVVTANLSAELAADLTKRADDRAKAVRTASKAAAPAAEQSQEAEADAADYAAPPGM